MDSIDWVCCQLEVGVGDRGCMGCGRGSSATGVGEGELLVRRLESARRDLRNSERVLSGG